LRDAFHIGAKAHGIAALVAGGEVRPAAGSQIDFERARTPIGPRRVQGDIFESDDLAARKDSRQHGGQSGDGRAVDGLKIHFTAIRL
jgi:hypothetical protein